VSTRLNSAMKRHHRQNQSRLRCAVTRHRPTTRRGAVVGSMFLGAATGLRGQLGVATVVARSAPSLPPMFRRPWTRRLVVAAAAGELVVDKLPATPSRLVPAGTVGRLAMGGWPPASSRRPGMHRGFRPPPSEPPVRPSRPRSAMTCGRDSPIMRPTRPSPSSRTPWRSGWPPRAPHADRDGSR
jgi:hypothetical protein